MESKKDIRRYVLSVRENLTAKEQDEKSHNIFCRVINHPFFMNADTIYCYVDYMHEVKTRSIIQYAWKQGKRVAVPKIVNDQMIFCFIEAFEDLKDGYRGIPEPTDCKIANSDSPLVIMPGVAFDKSRNRIGYGKGFYDKFLALHPNFHTIALGFDVQIVDKIPSNLDDIQPEILITENCIYDE